MFGLERWLLRACLVSMMISRIKKTKEKKKSWAWWKGRDGRH